MEAQDVDSASVLMLVTHVDLKPVGRTWQNLQDQNSDTKRTAWCTHAATNTTGGGVLTCFYSWVSTVLADPAELSWVLTQVHLWTFTLCNEPSSSFCCISAPAFLLQVPHHSGGVRGVPNVNPVCKTIQTAEEKAEETKKKTKIHRTGLPVGKSSTSFKL